MWCLGCIYHALSLPAEISSQRQLFILYKMHKFQFKYIILNFLTYANLYMIEKPFFIISLSYNAINLRIFLYFFFLDGLRVRILYLSLSIIAHVFFLKQ